MKHRIRQLVAWAGLALAVGAPGARAQGFRTLDAGGGLHLHQVGSRVTLRQPAGAAAELTLPPGAAARRLAALDGGWLLAGEVDSAGYSELFLLAGEGGESRTLAPPPNVRGDRHRAGPLPLVEDGRLAGLAWVSGAGVRESAVWAARRSGEGWSPPELVSPVGPGTQIAVDGAVLADGSWLLVWSAYDGEDDEILWSRRTAEGWSAPARLHEGNAVPDGLPSLLATGRGALVAWSWYDGATYRVRLAAFGEGSWRELRADARPIGAHPGLTADGGRTLLLYRVVAPRGWKLSELDAAGDLVRSALVETMSPLRPAVTRQPGGDLALAWPADDLAAAEGAALDWRAEP